MLIKIYFNVSIIYFKVVWFRSRLLYKCTSVLLLCIITFACNNTNAQLPAHKLLYTYIHIYIHIHYTYTCMFIYPAHKLLVFTFNSTTWYSQSIGKFHIVKHLNKRSTKLEQQQWSDARDERLSASWGHI